MTEQTEILDFLAQEENLKVALKLSKSLPKLKTYISSNPEQKDEALELLSQPTNLMISVVANHYLGLLKENALRIFWQKIHSLIPAYLEKYSLADQWQFKPVKNPNSQWAYCTITPKWNELPAPRVEYILQQGTPPNYELLFCFRNMDEKPKSRAIFKALKNQLSHQFTMDLSDYPYKGIGFSIHSAPFMSEMHFRPDDLISQIANQYWQFFQETEAKVRAVDWTAV